MRHKRYNPHDGAGKRTERSKPGQVTKRHGSQLMPNEPKSANRRNRVPTNHLREMK